MAFLLFAIVAAVTPGPSNIMLTAAGAQAGILKGLPCVFGVVTGMGLMMFLIPLGLGSLVLEHPLPLKALNWSGAVLVWLSWRIATSSSRVETNPVGYVGAAVFQWVNPKSWLVSASAAGTFLSPDGGEVIPRQADVGTTAREGIGKRSVLRREIGPENSTSPCTSTSDVDRYAQRHRQSHRFCQRRPAHRRDGVRHWIPHQRNSLAEEKDLWVVATLRQRIPVQERQSGLGRIVGTQALFTSTFMAAPWPRTSFAHDGCGRGRGRAKHTVAAAGEQRIS